MPAGNPLKACSTECGVLQYLHRAVNGLAVNLQMMGLQAGLRQPVLDMPGSWEHVHTAQQHAAFSPIWVTHYLLVWRPWQRG